MLSFLLQLPYSKSEDGAVYLIGQSSQTLDVVPSHGLRQEDVQAFGIEGASIYILGDKALLRGNESQVAKLREALSGFAVRPFVLFDLAIVETDSKNIQTLNSWLDGFKAQASLKGGLGIPMTTGYTFEVKDLFELEKMSEGLHVQLNQTVQLTSGSKTRFATGRVLTDELFTNVAESGQNLQSGVERRTVGLTLEVDASEASGTWALRYKASDGDVAQNQQETTTELEGEHRAIASGSWGLLATYTRKTTQDDRSGIRGLRQVPLLGKLLFQRKEGSLETRQVTIYARLRTSEAGRAGASPLQTEPPPQDSPKGKFFQGWKLFKRS